MLLFVSTGTSYSVLAAEKEVTYREQNGSEDTNLVFVKAGESIDLKFIGASDYKNYEYSWTSSDTSVATVTSAGIVTGKKNGTAIIKFVMKNSSYVTKGCTVVVSEQYKAVEIMDSQNKTIKNLTLANGKSAQLYVKNLNTYSSGAYALTWVSDNGAVVSVDNGKITAKSAGTANVRVQIKNLSTGEILPNVPLLVTVPGTVSATPTPVPKVTVTPVPTIKPTVTPIPKDVAFVAEILGDSKVKVVFSAPAEKVTAEDITFTMGKNVYTVESVSWNTAKTEAVLSLKDVLTSGKTYTMSISGYEKKIQVKPVFSAPDRIVLVWDCLGKENKAYTQNTDMDLEIPTNLSVEIYAGGLDVTRTWETSGYAEYKLINQGNILFDFCDDYLLFHKAGDKAQISADFSFTYNKKEYKVSSGTYTIVAEKAPAYKVISALDFAFLPSSSTAMVDWKNPIQTLVANDDVEYTVITMFKDNYGYTYASDRRGANETMGISSADDKNAPFGALDWETGYSCSGTGLYVSDDGKVTVLKAINNGVITFNVEGNGSKSTAVGSFKVKATEARRLASITAQQTEIELTTDALEGHDSFVSVARIPLTLKDQYGKLWKDTSDLEVSVSGASLDDSAYSLEKDVLLLDVSNMEPTSGKAVITISGADGGVKEKVTVLLKKPSYDRNEDIVVSGWDVAKNMTVSAFPDSVSEVEHAVRISPYHVSRTIQVGLVNENVFAVANADKKYSSNTCAVGDTYISVKGPGNKAVSVLGEGKKGLGIRQEEDGSVVLVTSSQVEFGKYQVLASGDYTVTVVHIKDIVDDRVVTAKKTQKITILSEIPEVTVGDKKSSIMEYAPTDKETAKLAASEYMQILVDGMAMDNLTIDEIDTVSYSNKNNRFTVSGLEVWVPSKKNPAMMVKVSLKNIGQAFSYEKE